MLTIYLRTLKDRRMSTIAYAIGSVAFMWMYVALFPTIRDQSANFAQLLSSYPKGFLEAFGFNGVEMFSHMGSYLSTEMFSFIFPIILVALAVSFGSAAIAGEIERGTIEFLLSQPVSRTKLFFSRYLAGASAVAGYTAIVVFSIIPFSKMYDSGIAAGDVARFWVMCFLFGLAILSLSFLASAIFSDKGKPNFIVTGIIILMYVLKILASLKPSLDKLKFYSFMYYYDPSSTLGSGAALAHNMLWVFLGTSVISTLLAVWWFNRRDITPA